MSGICTAFVPVLKVGIGKAVPFLRVGASEERLVCTAKPCDVLKVKNAFLQGECYVKVFTFYTVVTKQAGWLVAVSKSVTYVILPIMSQFSPRALLYAKRTASCEFQVSWLTCSNEQQDSELHCAHMLC